MSKIAKRKFSTALPVPVVGCGMQGADCLALAVSGRPGGWFIHWARQGGLIDPAFSRDLSRLVGRSHLWTPPTDDMAAPMSVACRIDTEGVGGKKLGRSESADALFTQIRSRLEKVTADALVICGFEMESPDRTESILIGGGIRKSLIQEDYRNWRREMGILNPHIASSGLALANIYLTLYAHEPEPVARLVVLEGRMTTHAVLIDGWKFVDGLEFGMLEQEPRVGSDLIEQWRGYFAANHVLTSPPKPLVIPLDGGVGRAEDVWMPLESPMVAMAPGVEDVVSRHPDLAAMAFGMALQGGC